MDLEFDRLTEANVRRCETHFHPIPKCSLIDWSVAVAGEAGEVLDAVKKVNCGYGKRTEVATEIGDVVVYSDLLCQAVGMSLGAVYKDGGLYRPSPTDLEISMRTMSYWAIKLGIVSGKLCEWAEGWATSHSPPVKNLYATVADILDACDCILRRIGMPGLNDAVQMAFNKVSERIECDIKL